MKFGRILFALLFLLLALSLVACDSEENKDGVPDSDVNISNVKYMPYEKYVGDIYLTEDEKEEILEILNGGKWINDLTNCAADYEFTWGKATVRYHSGCGTFTDITNGRALETSEDQETRINQILKESESGIGMEIIADFSIYLDKINFVSGVSQKDFCEMMEKYTYEGKKITDVLVGADFDSANGGGYSASGDLFGFKNEYTTLSSDLKAIYINSFYTEVKLGGLILPYGITFDDTITDVFEKLGIEKDPQKDFVVDPDCTDGTTMTIWKKENSSLIFYNLALSTDPVEYEHRYKLKYTETYQEQKDGKTVTVTRSIEFYIDRMFGDDTVDEYHITVKESYDL